MAHMVERMRQLKTSDTSGNWSAVVSDHDSHQPIRRSMTLGDKDDGFITVNMTTEFVVEHLVKILTIPDILIFSS